MKKNYRFKENVERKKNMKKMRKFMKMILKSYRGN